MPNQKIGILPKNQNPKSKIEGPRANSNLGPYREPKMAISRKKIRVKKFLLFFLIDLVGPTVQPTKYHLHPIYPLEFSEIGRSCRNFPDFAY